MKIKEHTINFFKKHNLEFNSDFIDFVTLFKIDFKKNKPKIINYNTSSFSDFEKQFSKDLIESNNYIIEINGEEIFSIDRNIWELIKSIEGSLDQIVTKNYSKNSLEIKNKNLTIVTGLWNIGRPNRSFETYLEQFENFQIGRAHV